MKVSVPAVQRLRKSGKEADIYFYLQLTHASAGWKSLKELKQLAKGESESNEEKETQFPSLQSKNLLEGVLTSSNRLELENDLSELIQRNDAARNTLSNLPVVDESLLKQNSLSKDARFGLVRNALLLLQSKTEASIVGKFKKSMSVIRRGVAAVAILSGLLKIIFMLRSSSSDRILRMLNSLFAFSCGAMSAVGMYEANLNQQFKKTTDELQEESGDYDDSFSEEKSDTLDETLKKILRVKLAGEQSSEEVEKVAELDDELKDFVKDVDTLDKDGKYLEGYEKIKELVDGMESVPFELAWRFVRQSYNFYEYGKIDKDQKLSILNVATSKGKDLVDKYPEKPEAHKWYAICVVEFQKQKGSTKEEIKGGFMFYKHATKALELDDSDPSVHYMMGKFCFAVAKLSYFERKAAKAVFGVEPPNSTFEQALEYFQKSSERQPNGLNAYLALDMARCYVKMKKKDPALEYISKCVELAKDDLPADQKAKEQAIRLKQKL